MMMQTPYTIDHIQLAMPPGRENEARTFFVAILEFIEIAKPPELAKRGGAWFTSGAVTLHVGVDPAFVPAKKAHPALRCADYIRVIGRLRERGIAMKPDPIPFDGRDHCYIEDPFGNRIELIAS